MHAEFGQLVFKAMASFEKRYRAAVVRNGFRPLYWAYFDQSASAAAKKAGLQRAYSCLDFQIQFIRIMAGYLMFSGKTDLLRIRKFLSCQMPDVEAGFQVTFRGGRYPQAVMIKIRELKNFDFACAYRELGFNNICLWSDTFRVWSKEKTGSVCRRIIDDLKTGGFEIELKIAAGPIGPEVCLECRSK